VDKQARGRQNGDGKATVTRASGQPTRAPQLNFSYLDAQGLTHQIKYISAITMSTCDWVGGCVLRGLGWVLRGQGGGGGLTRPSPHPRNSLLCKDLTDAVDHPVVFLHRPRLHPIHLQPHLLPTSDASRGECGGWGGRTLEIACAHHARQKQNCLIM
jgi:hypothetical protein